MRVNGTPATHVYDEAFIGGMLARGLPILEFVGGRKNKDSLYTKLLSKQETVAAQIYDKLRFRLIAVAHTPRQFGGAESSFKINKPVMVEPALPRFANVGDDIVLRAVVHNQGQRAGEVRVELALDGHAAMASGSERARTVNLAPGASGFVEFPVRFTEPGTARWIWRAKMADPETKPFTDAVESKLEVGWPQPLLRETHLARSGPAPVNLLANVNPQLLEGRGSVHLRVANSRLVELSECVSHLLHYPYGCAEQTSSALLPWLLTDAFPEVLQPQAGLRRETAINIKRLMDLGCYRGLRHRKQLPVRGQRTHTNARTRKGKAKPIAGKKK